MSTYMLQATVPAASGAPAAAAAGGAEAALAAVLEAMATFNRRTLAMMNSNYKEVLRAMRGELSKETKRLESVFAANDARVVQLVSSSAARVQARPFSCPNLRETLYLKAYPNAFRVYRGRMAHLGRIITTPNSTSRALRVGLERSAGASDWNPVTAHRLHVSPSQSRAHVFIQAASPAVPFRRATHQSQGSVI